MIHDTHICLRLKSGIEKQDNKKEKGRKRKGKKDSRCYIENT
jgi:hypothetical protein